jgi:hypothetical protein
MVPVREDEQIKDAVVVQLHVALVMTDSQRRRDIHER